MKSLLLTSPAYKRGSHVFLLPAGLFVLAAVLCPACSNHVPSSAQPATLRMGVSVPATSNRSTGVSAIATNLVSETLVSVGWTGRPTPKLVAAWKWSEDRLSVHLELERNIRFHDGTPLVAARAAEVLRERLSDPTSQAQFITYRSVKSIESVGDHTLVVHLSRPEAFFLADLSNSAITHPTNHRIGTGPFRYQDPNIDQSKQDEIRLSAFEQYYRGRPTIGSVELRRYEEHRAAWAALMRGDIDAVHEVSPGAMDFVDRQTTVRTFPHTRPYYIQLLFNLRHAALRKPTVRQALSHAVDRESILRTALHGRGVVADGPIWPQHWAYSAPPRKYSLNSEAASLLLNAAGYLLKPAAEPGRMKSRFRFVCLTLANDARYEKIGIMLQKQFFDVGVDMEVVALPWDKLGARIGTGDFDALLMERTSGRSLAWTYPTYHSTFTPIGYRTADLVLERLRSSPHDNDTRAAVGELQRILYEDPPAIFLAWPIVARAVSNSFEVPGETGRDVMGSLWQWQPAAAVRP